MLPTTWEPETTFDWKIKIEPENFLLKMDNNFSNLHLFFGFHVNFQGCMTRLGELESNTMVLSIPQRHCSDDHTNDAFF